MREKREEAVVDESSRWESRFKSNSSGFENPSIHLPSEASGRADESRGSIEFELNKMGNGGGWKEKWPGGWW